MHLRNCLFLTLLLSGCALSPSHPPTFGPPNCPDAHAALPHPTVCPAVIPSPVATPSPADDLLTYYRRVRDLSGADLTHELALVNEQGHGEHSQLQRAMLFAQARDWQRAQNILDTVLKSPDSSALPYKPLAQLLADNYGEQHRLEDQGDKQQQQARDLQKHVDQLNDKLEALKNIERNLPVRADGGAPAAGSRP